MRAGDDSPGGTVLMNPSKCIIEWLSGSMAGTRIEAFVYNPRIGMVVEELWNRGSFKVIEILDNRIDATSPTG